MVWPNIVYSSNNFIPIGGYKFFSGCFCYVDNSLPYISFATWIGRYWDESSLKLCFWLGSHEKKTKPAVLWCVAESSDYTVFRIFKHLAFIEIKLNPCNATLTEFSARDKARKKLSNLSRFREFNLRVTLLRHLQIHTVRGEVNVAICAI